MISRIVTINQTLLIKIGKLVLLLMILFGANISSASALQAFFWSSQKRIPEYTNSTEEPPFLIADQNHVVHAFNSQPLELGNDASPKAIYYRQWTLENGWTTPNDILFDENGGSINLVGIIQDKFGVVHLVFLGSNLNLYYTYAYLSEAGSTLAWAEPQIIASNATRSGSGFEYIGTIAADTEVNNLVAIYSGSQYGNGLYYVFSLDRGLTWSEPYLVYLSGGDDFVVTDPKLIAGESGVFHAVWSNFRSDGAGGSGYYAAWDPITQLWSDPMALDVPGIRTPSIVEHNANLILSYHHISSNGNWWRLSNDDGKTWTSPIRVSPRHVGTNGALSFAIDSDNTLHAFFGERIDDFNHGMWHIVWTGNSWSNPEAVVRGPQVRDVPGGDGFDPRSARAVISNGNVLLVTWGTDGFGGVNGAWYSFKQLNTPELPAVPLLTPPSIIQGAATESFPAAVPTSVVESAPSVLLVEDASYLQILRNPQTAILLGVIPVVLVLLGIIVVRFLVNSRNN